MLSLGPQVRAAGMHKGITFNQRHYEAYGKEYMALDSNYKDYFFTTLTYIPRLTINKNENDQRNIQAGS